MFQGIDIGADLVKNGLAIWESTSHSDDPSIVDSCTQVLGVVHPDKSSASMKPVNHTVPNPSTLSETPSRIVNVSPGMPEMESSVTNGNKSEDSASSSFINKEKSQTQRRGFKPKTLATSSKKQPSQSKANVEGVLVLPETNSDGEFDEDGFSLG